MILGTTLGAQAMRAWSRGSTFAATDGKGCGKGGDPTTPTNISLSGGGHIVNISSLGALMPVSGVALYQATKFGVRGYSLCASKDFLAQGLPIAATVVCPDAVATPMKELQLAFDESAMAYSGGDLSAAYVVQRIVRDVLPTRPVEVLLGAGACRAAGAVLCAPFHSSRLVHWIEGGMRAAGMRAQRSLKAKKQQ